jgi:hypothetical protein
MAASESRGAVWLGGLIPAGLRPEPQSAYTQAAGAAYQAIGVDAKHFEPGAKIVFGRHSTQSSIAAEPTLKSRGFKALVVDAAVYRSVAPVYTRRPSLSQVAEYRSTWSYTAKSTTEPRGP